MARFNYFENSTDDELKNYYKQYKSFQMEGVIPEGSELRKAADAYIAKISGAWMVPFATDLLEAIADRWIDFEMKTEIKIRNNNYDLVATFLLSDGFINEETMKGCYISDTDGLSDGDGISYRIDLETSDLSKVSNEDLLSEITRRLKATE